MKKYCSCTLFRYLRIYSSVLIIIFCSIGAFAQKTNIDLSQFDGIQWKPVVELYTLIDSESIKMNNLLSLPNLSIEEKTIYNAELELLKEVKNSISRGTNLVKAFRDALDKINVDKFSNHKIKALQIQDLENTIPALVELFQVQNFPRTN